MKWTFWTKKQRDHYYKVFVSKYEDDLDGYETF